MNSSAIRNSRFATLNQLLQADLFLQNGLAKRTRNTYNSKYNPFVRWAKSLGICNPLDRPLSEADVILYCTHRAQSVDITTIKGDLCALRSLHIENGWYWPDSKTRNKDWPLLSRVLRGIEKSKGPRLGDNRKAISLAMLRCFYANTNFNNFNNELELVIMLLLFFGLFRISELCNSAPETRITFNDIQFIPNPKSPIYIKICLKVSKSSQCQHVWVTIGSTNSDICPVLSLKRFMLRRAQCIESKNECVLNSPVFVYECGKHIEPTHIRSRLKKLLLLCNMNVKDYNTHSFRMGGATILARNGISHSYIKAYGRWKSNVFMDYVRPSDEDLAGLAKIFFSPPKYPHLSFDPS